MTLHFILLAAGFGSRFGSNKLLAALKGKPLYRHGFDSLLALKEAEAFPMSVTVVTQYPEIVEAVRHECDRTAVNEDPARGQTSSIQTGIQALLEDRAVSDDDYLVFLAADQPYVSADLLRRFASAVIERKPKAACFAVDGRFRNPGAFSAGLIPELMALTGDGGGRDVLKNHQSEVYLFTDFEAEALRDIDRPEDLL